MIGPYDEGWTTYIRRLDRRGVEDGKESTCWEEGRSIQYAGKPSPKTKISGRQGIPEHPDRAER